LTIAQPWKHFTGELPEARIVWWTTILPMLQQQSRPETLRRLGASGEVISELRQRQGNAVRRAFSKWMPTST